MNTNTFPTKGNLLAAKKTLRMSIQGYDLLDKKRNILIREIMDLNEKAKELQFNIEHIFSEAYLSLQSANIEMGMSNIERISANVPIEETVKIKVRSVMGAQIPVVSCDNTTRDMPFYGMSSSSSELDAALQKFNDVKDLIIQLSMIENAAYRLAINIKKTQKRANALRNIMIPKYEKLVKSIQETLEERERDEFTRLKVIKRKS